MDKDALVLHTDQALSSAGITNLLDTVRPEWKSKSLIARAVALLKVDPGSACQKILNAAVHDLRQKIVIAGLDLAKQASVVEPKLPPITRKEDVLEGYTTFNVLELAHRIGLLSRPEWKRLRRAYDIRRDLEHEDDEYTASLEDVVYIFKSSIEIVLSREPQELLRVDDVEELIQSPENVTPSAAFLEDYSKAPEPRQIEIGQYLIRTALNDDAADIVRNNAVDALRGFAPTTRSAVKITLAGQMQERTKRKPLSLADVKVAEAGGFRPYLKQRQLEAFFADLAAKFNSVGHVWTAFAKHHALLDSLDDCGGLEAVPAAVRPSLIRWMLLCYIGEPGGYGAWGQRRKVFYSDAAAPMILRLLERGYNSLRQEVDQAATDPMIKSACKNEHVKNRLKWLLEHLRETSEAKEE